MPRTTTSPIQDVAGLRVAIVHDWLLGMRGGERVLESLIEIFPLADVYTLFYDSKGVSRTVNRQAVRASPLNQLPGVKRYYRALLPALPSAVDRLEISSRYDLVISTSHCVAHGVRVPPGVAHLTYCFSPMRYLYDQGEAYAQGGSSLAVRMLGAIAPRLREWDRAVGERCGHYIAISSYVAGRVERIYGRKAGVIFPPVRTEYFTPVEPVGGDAPFLVVSALTSYKRVDLAVRAATQLGKTLWVAGKGPQLEYLRGLAGPTVRFLGWVDDARLRELYREAQALIFPGEEDFGIVPLEAMACGCPVIAYRAGGLLETHEEGRTGLFFDEATAESLAKAWESFDAADYDQREIRKHSERFGEDRFADEFATAALDMVEGRLG